MSRKAHFAASIFHIRWRLARNGFASHAPDWRLGTGGARKLDPVEQSSDTHYYNLCISGGIRDPSYSRPVDSDCGNLSCFDCVGAGSDASW